ncbi:beta-fructofuranosidase, insoluble isoenzyme CWINV1-like isoform X2 [Andrographis paniculata]|nr:beta-fructofuranosidase, insoluble isoenzyme CWINV1-like isoform X2 [Andrographis paniculata]XP_051129869.1 beta-fructofuranosidase, insoluble isoenzyme CWINV1-like isoform X2 [Andrographis paniculata]
MYYKGVYHLFYQYNPYGAKWGNITWAHSVSHNLIHWIHLPHAIQPSHPFDIQGCFSGSATILASHHHHHKPLILYTGLSSTNQQVQNLATPKNMSDPFLIEWDKSSHNPLMTPPVGIINPNSFRDPTTGWRGADNTWRVVIGGEIDGHGAAVLYKSDDFVTWERAHSPLHSSNKTNMWECPDFYPVRVHGKKGIATSTNGGVGIKHVLKASFHDHDYYILGTYDTKTDRFNVTVDFMDDKVQLRYDYGLFYASKSFYDPGKKRRLLWGWVTEADSEANQVKRGWSGLQSMVRSVSLHKTKKQLIQWPVKEVEKLRRKKVSMKNKELVNNSVIEVEGISASQADVEVSFHLPNLEGVELINENMKTDSQLLCRRMNASVGGKTGPFGLLVLASKNLTEQTAIFFRVFKIGGKYAVLMCSDQSRSSVETPVKEPIFGAFVDIDPSRGISLRTLIDHSIVESFGGRGVTCITARVYPKLAIAGNSHIHVFNNGEKNVVVSTLRAWSMEKAHIG